MATFKVGQRVRVIGTDRSPKDCNPARPDFPTVVGRQATILGPLKKGWDGYKHYWGHPLDVDGIGRLNDWGRQIIAKPKFLVPLTDPKADSFIESIRKMKPYEEPKVEKVKV